MSKYEMLLFVSGDNNNNKFYEVKLDDNGMITKRWGRLGLEGQSSQERGDERSFDSIVRAKKSKGYVKAEVVDNSSSSEIQQSEKGNLQEYAKEDLSSEVTTKEEREKIISLVNLLVESNRHQISASSGGKITIDESGVIKTPIGLLKGEAIEKARKVLEKLQKHVEKDNFDSKFTEMLDNYLSLVPQKVPARKGWHNTFFKVISTIEKQADLLDQLEASLDLYDQKKNEALKRAEEEKNKDGKPRERLFNCKLRLIEDSKIFKEIESFYEKGRNSNHVSSKLKLVRVYAVHHDGMRKDFEEKKTTLGNVKRLWHGTRMFNILSILKSGMFIPKEHSFNVTGRMFGNGIYMSDMSTKSLNYAYGYWDSYGKDNHCFMFLMKAAMGNEYLVKNERGNQLPKAGYDSAFAKAGSSGVANNEMMVYDAKQVDIEYLCEFKEVK